MDGFIALHRGILEWEWYNDINVKVLFIHVLLKANWEDKVWRGINIKRGQYLTSLSTLASETGLTIRQVRVTIEKLKVSGEMTQQSTATYTILGIVNYNKYQTKMTKGGQSDDKPDDIKMTTTNNRINNNLELDILRFWNSKKVVVHEENNKKVLNAISKALKNFSKEQILRGIDVYAEVFLGEQYFFSYKWGLSEFLSRERGLLVFMDKKPEDYIIKKDTKPEKKSLTQMFEENPNFF